MDHQNMTAYRALRYIGVALGAALISLSAYAQNAIEAVTGSIQGGTEVIRIDLTQPLAAVPTGFSIQVPARIALDFPGVTNGLGRSTVDINQGNLKSVNVVQAGERTRVVLNLKRIAAYKTEIQGKSLLISLESTAAAGPAVAATSTFAENGNRDTLPIKNLDFRRGTGDTGKVVVDLANDQVGVDIRQQGQTLVVEFMKSSLPEGLRRRLDVADFGTPVQTITTFQSGDRVRMVIEPKGAWEHSAYQSGNQFVVEVRPQKIDPTKLTQGPGYNGEKLSLNFQNIEVRALLQVIADFTNFNVVTSDSVTGSLTLRLKDVPWDQALDIILQAKGLGMRKNGNVLWIAPKDELDAKEKRDLESQAAIQGLEPLRTQSFQLNYAKAVTIAGQLNGVGIAGAGGGGGGAAGGTGSARILSPRGSVIAEPRTNQLFVSDIASKLDQVQQLISKLDIPVRQVLIEARIVEATDTFSKSLGVRLGGGIINGRSSFGTTPTGSPPPGLATTTYSVTNTGGITTSTATATNPLFNNGNFINLPATSNDSNSPGTFALSLFNSSVSRMLNLEISALEADGKGKVVSSPRVVTADQTKAIIEQGTQLPYQTATSSGATSIAFQKANLSLEVTPQITPEGNIILDLDVSNDSVGQATSAGFAINTKHVKTQVLVENGGTVVIGGIYTLTETNNTDKVPLLGDIPVVGNLFKTNSRVSNKQEMLVFITPKMITDRNAAR
ncbi:type IV pilus secretin PilQ [Rhodoferax sediminis]|uniref:Type IV pilus biogenesis and competence protein PilQ n=1 Tax=Rhodoferax sediminis TaxID=2509614 RepID=A0A515D826_9BURK|nr:type IV pilus secretin PilQ [Rhodoferax sediminis]QDL36517.1 type IV pilus secretin PilQ [Rhodoferax sediminis]